jgi:hypothetical protein
MGSDAADDRGLGGLRLQVGEHHWAVPLDGVGAVAEAGPLTALPGATGPLEGLARIADRPFPQIDLAAALGGAPGHGRQVAVVQHSGHWLALRVDRLELTPLAASDTAVKDPFVAALDTVVAALVPPAPAPTFAAVWAEPTAEDWVQLLLVDRGQRTVAVMASAVERVERTGEALPMVRAGAPDWLVVTVGSELLPAEPLPTHCPGEASLPAHWGLVVGREQARRVWLVTSVRGLMSVPRRQLRFVRPPSLPARAVPAADPPPMPVKPLGTSPAAATTARAAAPAPAQRSTKARSRGAHARVPAGPALPPGLPADPMAAAAMGPVWLYCPEGTGPIEVVDPEARLGQRVADTVPGAVEPGAAPSGLEVHCGGYRCLLPEGVAREVRSVTTLGREPTATTDLAAIDGARLLATPPDRVARRALQIEVGGDRCVGLLVDHVAAPARPLAPWLPAPPLPVTTDGLFDGIAWDGQEEAWVFRFGCGLTDRLTAALVSGEVAGWLPATGVESVLGPNDECGSA